MCDNAGNNRMKWWAVLGSNQRPPPCKGDALPTELTAHFIMTKFSLPRFNVIGGRYWARTNDLLLVREMLYQLS
ncbi:hypothetical protein K151_1016 [Proteus hauseri ZMd44]|nr:hypothetical protein K151_1016 [Proteus hauseri ZMd44]